MANESLIHLAISLIGFAFLLIFFRTAWQSVLVDVTRHRIFEIRDDIFMLAADGRLSFDSKTYQSLREYFNHVIRFTHKATIAELIAFKQTRKQHSEYKAERPIEKIIDQIKDEQLRREIKEKVDRTVMLLMILMVLRSPVALLVFLLMIPFLLLGGLLIGGIKAQFKSTLDAVRNDIDYEGSKLA